MNGITFNIQAEMQADYATVIIHDDEDYVGSMLVRPHIPKELTEAIKRAGLNTETLDARIPEDQYSGPNPTSKDEAITVSIRDTLHEVTANIYQGETFSGNLTMLPKILEKLVRSAQRGEMAIDVTDDRGKSKTHAMNLVGRV